MLKFLIVSLCVATFYGSALAGVIEPKENKNFTNVALNLTNVALNQPEYAALYVNNKVFYVFLTRLNWVSAAEYCSSQNLVLASIDTKQDNIKLVQNLRDNRLLYNGAKFWIGGSDLGHNGYYAWLGNGRPFSFTNWLPGQPDNIHEHCTEMLNDGRWNDRGCEVANFVICENRCSLSSYDVPIYNRK